MIEKRIKYQEGGVHDPLEAIIFLMGKRTSPGGLSSAEEKELNRLMEETGFMSQKKAQGGRIKLAKKPKTKPQGIQTILNLHKRST